MKTKTQPIIFNSGDCFYQGCLDGLTKKQKEWAISRIKEFEPACLGVDMMIPYGIIKAAAKKKYPKK